MRVENSLAWFSVAFSVCLVLAFGADGWSRWEIGAIVLAFFVAVGFWLCHNYLDVLIDVIFGTGNSDIRPARETDIDAIHSIGVQHFGDEITDKETIRSLIRSNKRIFWVMDDRNPRGTVSTIVGYACLFPLTTVQVQSMEQGGFGLTALTADQLPPRGARPDAVYVGAIAVNSWPKRAVMLSHIERLAKKAAQRTARKLVFAKTVTRHGLILVRRRQFVPVAANLNGLHCFWKKSVA